MALLKIQNLFLVSTLKSRPNNWIGSSATHPQKVDKEQKIQVYPRKSTEQQEYQNYFSF